MLIEPLDQWMAVTPEVFSDETNRSPDLYVRCIEQFHVDVHPRYKRNAAGYTMCNIFASDVVNYAMKAPAPHWVVPLPVVPPAKPAIIGSKPSVIGANGLPTERDPATKKLLAIELSGNGICQWLQTTGVQSYGWKVCTPEEACIEASAGRPTLVTWLNLGGIGHIGVIRPSTFPNIRLAQAGAANFVNGSVGNGFGTGKNLVYLSHA